MRTRLQGSQYSKRSRMGKTPCGSAAGRVRSLRKDGCGCGVWITGHDRNERFPPCRYFVSLNVLSSLPKSEMRGAAQTAGQDYWSETGAIVVARYRWSDHKTLNLTCCMGRSSYMGALRHWLRAGLECVALVGRREDAIQFLKCKLSTKVRISLRQENGPRLFTQETSIMLQLSTTKVWWGRVGQEKLFPEKGQ